MVLLVACVTAPAETPVTLVVDVDNAVQYRSDIADPARRGTDSGATVPTSARAFTDVLFIGDIVAVNGSPARGLWTSRQFLMNFNPAPQAGFAIADVNRGTLADCKWEFLARCGWPVCRSDHGQRLLPSRSGGSVGAFYGIRGQMSTGTSPNPRPIRVASMSENPGMRRILGGGTNRIVFHLLPANRPEVIAVYDAGFRPITPQNPASKGEILILRVSGLGPTRPGIIPAGTAPFVSEPLQEVNSTVEVMLNGHSTEVVNKVGWPGETDVYRVDFRVPAEAPSGAAVLRLTTAWIPGPEFSLPIR
jgi:uncharacterized protein (TIGR03437 family)